MCSVYVDALGRQDMCAHDKQTAILERAKKKPFVRDDKNNDDE